MMLQLLRPEAEEKEWAERKAATTHEESRTVTIRSPRLMRIPPPEMRIQLQQERKHQQRQEQDPQRR